MKQASSDFNQRAKQTGRRILLVVVLLVVYAAYFVMSHAAAERVIKELQAEAKTMALTNYPEHKEVRHDGYLRTREVLYAYESLGLNGEELFNRLSPELKHYFLWERTFSSERPDERCLKALNQIGAGSEFPITEEEYRGHWRYSIVPALVHFIADTNGDGEIDLDEAKNMYEISYGPGGKWDAEFTLKTCPDGRPNLWDFFINPMGTVKKSELWRYTHPPQP